MKSTMSLSTAQPIRLAREEDLAALPSIELSAGRLFVEHGFGDEVHASPSATWRPSLDAGLLWVADDGCGAPIAFLAARQFEDALYIAEVDVAFEFQRRRLGSALVEQAVQAAKSTGLAFVGLTTAVTPPWNAPAYQRMGFDICEQPPRWLAGILETELRNGQPDRCAMLLVL
ncbi:MAG TPA: GNAT family N-acetyltransferase [Devosia sp.]|jgi:GNAT superfamily N-acetyltransferase|uniref:GNAT family N-acetyltransferase n=1 Tax=Devosia sp. TaxID=1871048 RepID=UPI002DDD135A|nr:GNAT family N-acetyltransferase [Devosia sp.]HEV2517449.1 GNAT family N-acetyltransferase [Devosia sp.]